MNMSMNREVGLHLSKSWKSLVSCVKAIPWCWFSSSLLGRSGGGPFQGLPFSLCSPHAFLAFYAENGSSATPHGITLQKTVAVVCYIQSHIWYPVLFGVGLVSLLEFERGGDKDTAWLCHKPAFSLRKLY
jgi:hypothetical protein